MRAPSPVTWSSRLRGLTRIWRRSIQARVVISTVLLSAVVVGLVGWVLQQQITDGLVQSRADAAIAETNRAARDAEERLRAASSRDLDASTLLTQLVSAVVLRGDAQGYAVVVAGPISDSGGRGGLSTSSAVTSTSVPTRLVDQVEGKGASTGIAWTYTRIHYQGSKPATPGVVTGIRILLPADGGTYAIYSLYPMTQEQQTLTLVRRALLTSGVLLLLLVAGVAWVVTRQVVTPVRLARSVAERIAAGHLEERMRVRGQDDLARLGTSFNQMASSLQRQIRKLEDMSASQRRFVSDVSHELRTPLTTVRMASEVLHDAKADFDPGTARAAELLQTELDRFEELLAELLEISRFDAGAAVLDVEDVDLGILAHRVADSAEAMARARGTRIVVREPEGPVIAEADPRRVERIVRNLVINAIDYADSRDIVIVLGANDDAAALAVRDYGVGLAPGDEARVFNRFWRADPARTRTMGGTGLGLSISLEDALLHGGWLQAWGEPGEGAQFRLTLPRHVGRPMSRSPIALVPEDAGVKS